ncbi:MAG: hypothetical protein WC135_04730 [Bacteroidales bacterium]
MQNRVMQEMYCIASTVVDWVYVFTRIQYKLLFVESFSYCQREKGLVKQVMVDMKASNFEFLARVGELLLDNGEGVMPFQSYRMALHRSRMPFCDCRMALEVHQVLV